jgi:quercetin dioxygenase-like cupin family protein
MKKILAAACAGLAIATAAPARAADEAVPAATPNVLEGIPYAEAGMGRRLLVDEKPLLIMQAALKPGQSVPQHNANSNVHLLIVAGDVVVILDGKEKPAKRGDLVRVAFRTPMSVVNRSQADASFLIIKTPNPSEMTP